MLVKGADWFVDGAASMAAKFGIPQLVIGLTIVAMGTSAPEAAVSISAAMAGSAEITVGNIVGSNILNILIILGISAVITPLAVAKSTVRVEIPFMIFIIAVFLMLGFDGNVGWLSGIILVALFIAYLTYLFVRTKRSNEQEEIEEIKNMSVPKAILLTVVGLGVVVLGSQFTVNSASYIAKAAGMSERFIGLTIVALGTSLPELFTSVVAARKHNADIAIGNIVGSNIFNILFVVGLSSLIIPVPFAKNFIFDTAVAIFASVLLLVCCFKHRRLNRTAGIIMLLSYVAYFMIIL
jgi:cation:H+ antiporter